MLQTGIDLQCLAAEFHGFCNLPVSQCALGRVKDKAMRRSPNVALAISDPDDPYRYIQIRGKVTEITEQGAKETIDHLSKKYRGALYDHAEGEIRVNYKILPESIQTNF